MSNDGYQPRLKSIRFANGRTAYLVELVPTVSAQSVSDWLQMPPSRFSIVLHGGASNMTEAYRQKMVVLLRDSLVRFAQDNGALVADGGTDTGLSRVVGEAYLAGKATFPLLGVAVSDAVTYPGGPQPGPDRWSLNPVHSHFVIVDADEFGAESHMLASFAHIGGNPGVALAINGGDITRNEIELHARMGTPVITLKGTGRYADELADAPDASLYRAPFRMSATRLEVFDIDAEPPEKLYHLIRRVLLS
jgi:hypothetical protein